VTAFNLNGAGIAFFVSYVFHVLMIYLIVRRLSGFQYSTTNVKVGLLFILILVIVFCGFYGLPYRVALAVDMLVLTATSIYSIRQILNLVSPTLIPRPVLRMLEWFRLVEVAT
jgi:antigen flippase